MEVSLILLLYFRAYGHFQVNIYRKYLPNAATHPLCALSRVWKDVRFPVARDVYDAFLLAKNFERGKGIRLSSISFIKLGKRPCGSMCPLSLPSAWRVSVLIR